MLWKLIISIILAVGAYGRTVLNPPYNSYSIGQYDPYDEYSRQFANELCNATHAEDRVPEVKSAVKKFAMCVIDLFDYENITREMEEAERIGNYAAVIKKYCTKAPQLKNCATDLVEGVAPCLPADKPATAIKGINTTIDYFCDYDSARVNAFIKTGGLQCIQEKQWEMAYCNLALMSNISRLMSSYGSGVSVFLIPNNERCSIVDHLLMCMKHTLWGCSNPYPGILVQELYDVFMQNTCPEVTNDLQTGAQTGITEEQLKNKKLELEVRIAELEIWNRENELNVQHTALTSDVKKY